MAYGVVLMPDAETEQLVQGMWHELADRGMTSFLELHGWRPHLSLAVYDACACEADLQRIRAFANELQPFTLRFSTIAAFESTGVVYWKPDESAELTAVYQRFHNQQPARCEKLWPHYAPEAWVPHCTLAANLEPEEVGVVAEYIRPRLQPRETRIDTLVVAEFPPPRECISLPLGR